MIWRLWVTSPDRLGSSPWDTVLHSSQRPEHCAPICQRLAWQHMLVEVNHAGLLSALAAAVPATT